MLLYRPVTQGHASTDFLADGGAGTYPNGHPALTADPDEMLTMLERLDDCQPGPGSRAAVSRLSDYEGHVMPGLLQTEAYARAVIRGLLPEQSDEDIERRVEVRLRRQQVLVQMQAVRLWAILDEGVLWREVGGVAVQRAQLRHLVAAGRSPNITVQVLPFSAGAHVGMSGSFRVMEFAEPDPPLIYTENAGGGLFLDGEADAQRYRASFQRLAAQALSPDDTMAMMGEAAQTA